MTTFTHRTFSEEECVHALRAAAAELGTRTLTRDTYARYRRESPQSLPHASTIADRLGSWPAALRAAGLELTEYGARTVETRAVGKACREGRVRDEECIAALQAAAAELGVVELSSHAYEGHRAKCTPQLVSSSVIRKWLGGWGPAFGRALTRQPRAATAPT